MLLSIIVSFLLSSPTFRPSRVFVRQENINASFGVISKFISYSSVMFSCARCGRVPDPENAVSRKSRSTYILLCLRTRAVLIVADTTRFSAWNFSKKFSHFSTHLIETHSLVQFFRSYHCPVPAERVILVTRVIRFYKIRLYLSSMFSEIMMCRTLRHSFYLQRC